MQYLKYQDLNRHLFLHTRPNLSQYILPSALYSLYTFKYFILYLLYTSALYSVKVFPTHLALASNSRLASGSSQSFLKPFKTAWGCFRIDHLSHLFWFLPFQIHGQAHDRLQSLILQRSKVLAALDQICKAPTWHKLSFLHISI